jgi:hypothetical protein
MDSQARDARLAADQELLQAIQTASTIFTCEAVCQPPDRYTLTFRGKGLARDATAASEVSVSELHQIDLRLPYSYPSSPPDIRWLTPILHPNVSFSGFVNLADIGLAWTSDLPLDLVCERLWDVARAEFLNLDKATNFAAKNWFDKECQFTLPLDPRPLRDRAAVQSATNIVRYERRAGQGVRFTEPAQAGEVMVIDESTPTPPLPRRQPYVPIGHRRSRGDDDVIYIGPE